MYLEQQNELKPLTNEDFVFQPLNYVNYQIAMFTKNITR